MAIQKRYLQEMAARVYGFLSEGKDDVEIMDELNIGAEDYNEVKIAMFDMKAEELRKKPTEHVFVDYMIQQNANIKALSGMIAEFRSSSQHNALVGAVRARSEILDKIIKTGQEVGLIEKEPDKHAVISGVAIANLTNQELKADITSVVANLDTLVKKFGDGGMKELEVKDEDIYSGPKGKKPEPSKEE